MIESKNRNTLVTISIKYFGISKDLIGRGNKKKKGLLDRIGRGNKMGPTKDEILTEKP